MNSNTVFSSNIFKYELGSESKFLSSKDPFEVAFHKSGDKAFLSQIMDYDALYKFKNSKYMGGYGTTEYYILNKSQLHILDPKFEGAVINRRDEDQDIVDDNYIKDAEYGYNCIDKKKLNPLITEIRDESKEFSLAEQLLGSWVEQYSGDDSETKTFKFVIPEKDRDKSQDISSYNFENVDEMDPYYDIYDGYKPKKSEFEKISFDEINKIEVEEYIKDNGSMFSAFKEVSQEDLITANYSDNIFVNAGPGTGKTYTLLHKLNHMIGNQEVDPESIMILCFTNAAVKEIKDRMIRFADTSGRREMINVDARTFHSFSWWLIQQANELFIGQNGYRYIDYTSLSYDQSIEAAIRIVSKFGKEIFEGWSHFIVDEIQDLTDQRAILVLKMVEQCMLNNVGVTVCGDSCQAIYDYSIDKKKAILTSDKFYKRLFILFWGKVKKGEARYCSLTFNHRQTTELKALTLNLREAILNENKENMLAETKKIYKQLTVLEPKKFSAKASKSMIDMLHDEGNVCFMCRNNAQVLSTSSNLRVRLIKHMVNAYEDSKYYAGWIGEVFGDYHLPIVTEDDFKKKIEKYKGNYSVDELWTRLQEIVGSNNNVLEVEKIIEAIIRSKKDDPILRNIQYSDLIVSNIHKAKGREYDTVVLEQNFLERLCRKFWDISEYKTLYVALTRPKSKLFVANLSSSESVKAYDIWATNRKRWLSYSDNGFKRFEVRGSSDFEITSCYDANIQKYIRSKIKVGDEIILKWNKQFNSYDVFHSTLKSDKAIGSTCSILVDDMYSFANWAGFKLPDVIENLYVSGIYTEFSDAKNPKCWVDFCGLGHCRSESY